MQGTNLAMNTRERTIKNKQFLLVLIIKPFFFFYLLLILFKYFFLNHESLSRKNGENSKPYFYTFCYTPPAEIRRPSKVLIWDYIWPDSSLLKLGTTTPLENSKTYLS